MFKTVTKPNNPSNIDNIIKSMIFAVLFFKVANKMVVNVTTPMVTNAEPMVETIIALLLKYLDIFIIYFIKKITFKNKFYQFYQFYYYDYDYAA